MLKRSVGWALLDGQMGVGVHWRPQFDALFFAQYTVTTIEPIKPDFSPTSTIYYRNRTCKGCGISLAVILNFKSVPGNFCA